MELLQKHSGHHRRARYWQHLLANFLILGAALAVLLNIIWKTIPSITAENFVMPQGIILNDATGGELYRFYRDDDRINLGIDEFPESLKNAVIAIEDERFYQRGCIDFRAITRAAKANLMEWKSEGASTITQQLIRNTFDLHEKTFSRKVLELLIACKMEAGTSKDEILRLYLNHASFGGSTYGAQKASLSYFASDVRNLSVAQSAILAALLQGPTHFSPYGPYLRTTLYGQTLRKVRRGTMTQPNQLPEEGVNLGLIGTGYRAGSGIKLFVPGRADRVLLLMHEQGMINAGTLQAAEKELQTMHFAQPLFSVSTPYFPSLVQKEATAIRAIGRNCSLQTSGCTIVSTLDPTLQHIAENVIHERAPEMREKFGAQNIAMVVVDAHTRGIVAYIGNVDFSSTKNGARIDMAQVPRQPGSTFKPFVYARGFSMGFLPSSFLFDGPISLGENAPKNYAGDYHGWVSIRHALAGSRNIPAILMYFMVGGEDPVLDEAARAGITEPLTARTLMRQANPSFSYGYPLAIGAAETPLLQMVEGYTTIANDGWYQRIRSVDRILDGQNQTVYSSEERPAPTQAMRTDIARELTSILSDNTFREGQFWKDQLTLNGIDAAAKTGTSNQCATYDFMTNTCASELPTDVWTIGYTPQYVVGVWAGNATHDPLFPQADGLNVAAPIWKEFLEKAHAAKPNAPRRFR